MKISTIIIIFNFNFSDFDTLQKQHIAIENFGFCLFKFLNLPFQISKFSPSLAFLRHLQRPMVYLGPKLCVTGADLQAALEKGESGLLETELFGDHNEKHNAQKSEEDEIAIKNNDVSVDELEEEIKDIKRKVVINSYS